MAWSLIIFLLNINLSIDFTGGMNIRVASSLDENFVTNADIYLAEAGFDGLAVSTKSEDLYTDISIKTSTQDDAEVGKISASVKQFLLENKYIADVDGILQSSITGPSVGSYMQSAALKAIVLGLLFMVIYMLFSFAGIRKTIAPSILGTVTVMTMFFDILIPAGAFGLLMMVNPTVQVDTVFIIAILTIMGYSINDTIIIFDRVRENIDRSTGSQGIIYGKIFENSLWQTMRRSMGTSISTLLVIITMYIFGSGVIQLFAFTMGIGVISWTFSSIFIAAPLAYLMLGKFNKEKSKL